jgi:hypothetical protein
VAAITTIAAALAAPPVSAQSLYGAVVGTVADPSGAPVPGATVTALNTDTGLELDTRSGTDGTFAFRNLPPGVYDVRSSLQGFKDMRKTGIRVVAGNPLRIELELEVGTVAEAVTVTAESTLLQTEKADLHTEITSKEVVNLPLNQFRNFQVLLNLVPGATPAQLQNAELDTPGRALTTTINGTARNNNAFRIDGAVSVNIWLPHHVGYVQPAETIEMVNVSTNNFDADQGMAGGAAITVLTKSGTNQLRGSTFFFRSQDELNANTFNNNAFGLGRAPQSTSIYGGTLGGAIIKNKLFFFGGWERYAARRGLNLTYSVPSVRMRNGDFSEVSAINPAFRLYNPFTGGAGGVGREPFPNNTIPSNLISPVWRRALDFYPSPNTVQDLNGNRLADDFVQARTARSDRDNIDTKLSFQRSPSHLIWAKFSMLDAEVIDNFVLGFDEGSLGDTRTYVAGLGHTWTISPSLVLDGNLGMNRQDQTVTGPDYGRNIGLDVFGIPGTNGGNIRQSGLPAFDLPSSPWASRTPIYDLGPDFFMPVFRKERSYTFGSALTWVTGRHQVRTGIDVVRHELNHIVAESASFGGRRGGFQFGGLVTSTPGYIPQVWNEMAGFILGLPSLRQKGVQEIPSTGREWQYGFYVNDHWNATGKLTLNLGLRLERYPLMKRADSGIERLDFATYDVLLGGRGSVPEDVGIGVKKFYLAPRLGAAYRLTNDTVLRSGYGRTFNPLPWSRPLRGSYPYDIVFSQTAEQFSSFPIQSGIPPVPIPDLSSGRVRLPPNTFMRSPDPADVDRATIQQMNIAVEQRLPGDLSLEVAYVHTRTDGGYADINRNFSEPGAGQPGRKLFAVAGTTDVWEWGSRTRSRYHGLQMALNRPFKNGLLLKGAYTLSRAQNETDEDGWAQLMYSHPLVLDKNFALAGYDRTHVLQMGFVYELPWAKGSRSLLGRIVKNWQINGIGSAYSGVPFSVSGTNTALNCPGCGIGPFILVNVNGDPKPTGTPGSATEPWYDKANFSQPTGLSRDGFGTSRRNQFRTPSVWNVDLGLFRSFPMGRFRPELRIEAQNVFNHTNWGRPDITFTSPTFMTFTPAAAHQQVNAITATGTRERTIQVGLRLEF